MIGNRLTSKNGIFLVLQPVNFGVVTDLDTSNFTLTDSAHFIIKNDNDDYVTLEVIPANSTTDEFVETSFHQGWNEELVKAIKLNADVDSLLWGR